MKKKILITSMGGYGSLSLVTYLNNSIKKNLDFFGTHKDQDLLNRARKICKKIFLVPAVDDKKKYLNTNLNLIKKYKIDFAIPNSDREVFLFSKYRDRFKSKVFLPNHKDITLCQNKEKFLNFLKNKNLNHPYFICIKNKKDIDIFLKNKNTKKFYIRITKETSEGAYGAAILKNKSQLQLWLKIWKNFKNEKETSFTLSDYLPGRTFENLLIFREGSLIISKVYENLSYYLTSNAITGAGSTPATASSCDKKKSKLISQETIRVIEEISKQNRSIPNGVYHSSVRYDELNKPNVTEINIGRFPSTNGLFNLFGKYNIADIYMKILLEKKIKLNNTIDDDLGDRIKISRSLDQKPYISKITN